jgi:hypothetical protein
LWGGAAGGRSFDVTALDTEFWRKVDDELDKLAADIAPIPKTNKLAIEGAVFECLDRVAPIYKARFGVDPRDSPESSQRMAGMLKARFDRRARGKHLDDPVAERAIRSSVGDEMFEHVIEASENDADALRALGVDKGELCRWARSLAKQWHAPPNAKTANNLEVLAMNVTHFTGALSDKLPFDADSALAHRTWKGVAGKVPEFDRCMNRSIDFHEIPVIDENEDAITAFMEAWRESAYAKLEVGHKLCAALCMTDTDGIEVEAPWRASSIVVPDGLLEMHAPEGKNYILPHGQKQSLRVARIWCIGAEPVFIVEADGTIHRVAGSDWEAPPSAKASDVEIARRHHQAIINLVKGAFIALANPTDFEKRRADKPASHTPSQRSGPPDFTQARYLLSKPLSIDLRGELAEHLSGKRRGHGGGAPTVQFLVRGHWRQQAHGPMRSLRKTIWIEPFWKGPEETRVLLRHVKVADA